MTNPSKDSGIENEPHLWAVHHEEDISEEQAARLLAREKSPHSPDERLEHTVWDEPALAPELSGAAPQGELTYERWLTTKMQETTRLESFWTTLLVAAAAGPWGIVAAFASAGTTGFALLAVTVFGPVAEEIGKVAAALWVIEKRPYLFQSMGQILLCAVCGGLAFSAIENLIYMYVYVPDHTWEFVRFRWTVCVGLHVTCSFVAGVGLVRIWDNAIRNRRRPQLALGMPWFAIAMIGHGLYNLTVTIAEAAGWFEFGISPPTS